MLLSQAQKGPPVFFQRKSFNIIPGTEGTAGSVTGWDVASADTRRVDNMILASFLVDPLINVEKI